MSTPGIAHRRLRIQRITGPKFATPAEAVAHFGAVQAQDYAGSLWALGLRVREATDAKIEQAVAGRTILRTWPLRGTIHFVTPADARWLLALTAKRVIRGMAGRLRQLELDDDTFAGSRKALTAALEGGRQLARHDAYAVLEAAGISTAGQRGIHILGRLALDGLLCFGPREGKQPTFVLLDEWLPDSPELTRDEALNKLARRYFTGHGPATLADFTWWSGLTAAEARAGLESAKDSLARDEIDGQTYWLSGTAPARRAKEPEAHLLPVYDEYTVAYKDRSAVFAPAYARRPDSGNGIFRPVIVMDSQIVGTWTRKLTKGSVAVTPNLFRPLTAAERLASAAAADRYGAFLGLTAELAPEAS